MLGVQFVALLAGVWVLVLYLRRRHDENPPRLLSMQEIAAEEELPCAEPHTTPPCKIVTGVGFMEVGGKQPITAEASAVDV